ncbi:MAG: bifunctional UDP-N-acetylglucosamine diphosphorylase/glucosamine-1-phosphate N-acetyltransferase GlmU [Cohaesibacter sp.]|nr:bifunctional UDP-N-acetylglucosamine diphosphorylase/glucosamine-1-phosphate N-acetyltransferase GlmU [Cohaesibacter sp.]MCV6602570.1 bifunctional UDP-N-acetylglucosamine diphosphorylase/glucosamine-1-phosphate N-acetyltransferase GlmU [Cohaesibacter sp.]
MTQRTCQAIILAAGQGTRMKSSKPKVLHQVAHLPMVSHVAKAALESGCQKLSLVVGPDMEEVLQAVQAIHKNVQSHQQIERLGTAHAVLAAQDDLRVPMDDVIVLYGDTPLIQEQTITQMRDALAKGADIAVLGFRTDNPAPYGRLLEENGQLVAIREAKDASEDEKKINFCNAGIMAFAGKSMLDLLQKIDNKNAQQEYYLTDAVELANQAGLSVVALEADEAEVQGVNSRQELASVEATFQSHARLKAMTEGATLSDPQTVYFAHDTQIGRDVLIEQNVVFGPGVQVADNATIRAFSHLEGARVASYCVIGPYARLRPGAFIEEKAKIGNFCEVKKAVVDKGAKVNHLSYIGDAHVGEKANIGAGTITCNYDGFNKFKTEIGAGAFIGSNSALVAPVIIEEGAIVGAGSVITKTAKANSLTLTRAKQMSLANWAANFREKNSKS